MLDDSLEELSLTQTFERAHLVRAVVGELPTTSFALHRLVLAVLYRSIVLPASDAGDHRPSEYWKALWQLPEFPSAVGEYLDGMRSRFDLLDPARPFMQVADLTTAKGDTSGLEKLIADVPNGLPYFTTRAGRALSRITFAEAARWLVHVMAYDISGIKSGAVGDARVKGGKGYPIGTSWAGNLGGILIEGHNLRETLLLNLVLGARAENDEAWSGVDDLALWERPPLTAAVDPDFYANGPAAALTWPSRRLRLVHDPTGVTGVLIANGDPLAPQNSDRFEPMTTWRRSAPQEKKSGVVPVYMPRTHDPERSVWRGLEALLPQGVTERQGADAAGARSSASLDWVRRQTDALGPDYLIRTRAVGMSYGSQSSSTVEILDDSLVMHTGLLSTAELQAAAVDAVRAAEAAVNAVGDLARNLAVAAGGEGEGARDQARRMGFFALDGPFRRWLAGLDGGSDVDGATVDWQSRIQGILREIGDQLIADAGPMAFAGRPSALGRHIDAGLAGLYFRRSLNKALPSAGSVRRSVVTPSAVVDVDPQEGIR